MPSCFNVVPGCSIVFVFLPSNFSCMVSTWLWLIRCSMLFPICFHMMFIVFSRFSRGFPEVFPQLPPQFRPNAPVAESRGAAAPCRCRAPPPPLGRPGGRRLLHPATVENGLWKSMVYLLKMVMFHGELLNNQMDYLFQDDYIYINKCRKRHVCVISWFIFTYYIHICVWFVCRSTYILYINMTSAGGMTLRMCFVGMDQWSSCRNQNKRGLLAELEVSWNGGVPQNGWFNGKSH